MAVARHQVIAEKLASDHEIIEMLIIGMRSRSIASEWYYREIVVILYFLISHHQLLPQQYYHDAVLCLMDIREMEWKNFSMMMMEPFKSLHTLITECLKTLFRVPSWNREHHDDFLCAICFEEFDWPHTLQCGHSLCYVCLSTLLQSDVISDRFNVWCHHQNITSKSCPKCRQPINGQLNRDDKKSAFVLDRKLLNQMYSDPITVDDGKCTFKGTESDFWEYFSANHKMDHFEGNEVMKREFMTFCDFMKKQTTVQSPQERNESILKAREIKQSGNKLFGAKQYDEAIGEYQNALKICPIFHDDRATYYSNMALCYLKDGHYVDAFRAGLNGLAVNPIHVKLLNTALCALDKLLCRHTEDEKESKKDDDEDDTKQVGDGVKEIGISDEDGKCSFYPEIHSDVMSIGKSNAICIRHRVYDVIQYQLLWECELRYSTKMMVQHSDSMPYLQRLRTKDKFLKHLRDLGDNIQHYFCLNYEEEHYLKYLEDVDDALFAVHRVLTEKMKSENMNSVGMEEILKILLDDKDFKKRNDIFWISFVIKNWLHRLGMMHCV